MRRPSTAALVLAALTFGTSRAHAQDAADAAHLEATAREHAHEAPAASPGARIAPAQEVTGRMVEYGVVEGHSARGYLARPSRPPRGQPLPAVLLIHEWWGLNDNIRAMARRFAGEGYQVLALDVYGGRVATTPDQAREYVADIMQNSGRAAAHIRVATEFLTDRQRAPRIGVVGWCFGGGWALQAALLEPDHIQGAVIYYGRPITDAERLGALRAPLLGLFGAEDRSIPVATVQEMERVLRGLGKDVTIQIYPGAGHAFANPSGDSYRADAADDAWRRTTEFLARTVREPR
jgi:carboxymethylenebutenolidase